MPNTPLIRKILDRQKDLNEDIKSDILKDIASLFNYQTEYSRMLEVSIDTLTKEVEDYKKKMEANQSLLLEKSKMATIGEVTATLSHEINNQLMVMYGNCQIIEMINSKNPNPIITKSIETNIKTLESMSNLIKNIKKFSYHSNDNMVVLVEDSPYKLLNQTLSVCDHFLSKSKVKVSVSSSLLESFTCKMAPAELGQVILNLIKNAYDHVHLLEESKCWIQINLLKDNSKVRFEFLNGGELLPDQVSSRLFSPFFTTKEIGKGTGIGLSLSKKIVESMNGTISYSPINGAIAFVIELPCDCQNNPS